LACGKVLNGGGGIGCGALLFLASDGAFGKEEEGEEDEGVVEEASSGCPSLLLLLQEKDDNEDERKERVSTAPAEGREGKAHLFSGLYAEKAGATWEGGRKERRRGYVGGGISFTYPQ